MPTKKANFRSAQAAEIASSRWVPAATMHQKGYAVAANLHQLQVATVQQKKRSWSYRHNQPSEADKHQLET